MTGRVKELEEANKELANRLSEAEAKVEKIKGMLRRQVNDRFNRSSEKSVYINPDAQTPVIETTQSSSESISVKNETTSPPGEISQTSSHKKRKATPHGRVIPENIPVAEQIIEIPEGECSCSICGTVYRRTTMYEESSEIDIQIKVVRNHIKRVKYAKKCKCEAPELITAEKPPNIIYKSLYSTSLWVLFLMFKYCLQIPLYRQTGKIWNRDGAEFKNSTIIGGFKKLHTVLIPLYNAMIEKSKTQEHWHADETSWKVFTDKQDKKTFNWWMWVFASATVVVYILDRTRSASVPEKHLGGRSSGILNVDRYAAYKILSPMLLLALCRYHVRRDFIKAAVSFPQLSDWTQYWLGMISELEEINDIRVEAFVNDKPEFTASQALLESKVDSFFDNCQEQFNNPVLTETQQKIFKSLIKNKEGLTVFVDNPLVPMHNNLAERTLRSLAVARNNFYGSHAPWSGELAVICMSIYMTAQLHNINPEAYMEYYFHVCAKNESKPPVNLDPLLIWNLTDEIIDSHNLRNGKKIAS
jgi:transposase